MTRIIIKRRGREELPADEFVYHFVKEIKLEKYCVVLNAEEEGFVIPNNELVYISIQFD